MEQLSLYFEREEYQELRGLAKRSYAAVKKKFPVPVKGETMEEYREFIVGETLLEIAERLTEIALRRQKMTIDFNYKGEKYE
jgi:hypothetical protein